MNLERITAEQKECLDKNDKVMKAMSDLRESNPEQFEKERDAWRIAHGNAWGLNREDYDSLDSLDEATCLKMADALRVMGVDDSFVNTIKEKAHKIYGK